MCDTSTDTYVHQSDTRNPHYPAVGNLMCHPTGPQDASFTAENSFVHAPLNSRLNTTATREQRERERPPPLRDLSLEIQEALILEDMLSVLIGVEGAYVIRNGIDEPAQFVVDAGLDPALKDLVGRMPLLATH
ncbi:gamma-tubulin complex component 2 [Ceratobasidium sp. AG-Ba]|nr:gamma-tubulin complex component 2 [Ceratobasidium sp. AG-Ba]